MKECPNCRQPMNQRQGITTPVVEPVVPQKTETGPAIPVVPRERYECPVCGHTEEGFPPPNK